MRSFLPPRPRARDYIRPHQAIAATAIGIGIGIGFGAKYISAGLLILWLLAGGQ